MLLSLAGLLALGGALLAPGAAASGRALHAFNAKATAFATGVATPALESSVGETYNFPVVPAENLVAEASYSGTAAAGVAEGDSSAEGYSLGGNAEAVTTNQQTALFVATSSATSDAVGYGQAPGFPTPANPDPLLGAEALSTSEAVAEVGAAQATSDSTAKAALKAQADANSAAESGTDTTGSPAESLSTATAGSLSSESSDANAVAFAETGGATATADAVSLANAETQLGDATAVSSSEALGFGSSSTQATSNAIADGGDALAESAADSSGQVAVAEASSTATALGDDNANSIVTAYANGIQMLTATASGSNRATTDGGSGRATTSSSSFALNTGM